MPAWAKCCLSVKCERPPEADDFTDSVRLLEAEHLAGADALGAGRAVGRDDVGVTGDGDPPHEDGAVSADAVGVQRHAPVAAFLRRGGPIEMG